MEVFEHLDLVYVHAVAQGHGLGDVEVILVQHVQQDVTEDAALGDDGDVARHQGLGQYLHRGQAVGGVYQADAIGADDPDAVAPGDLGRMVLQAPAFLPHFGEAGTLYHHVVDAPVAYLLHHPRHLRRGNDDYRQVHRAGDVRHLVVNGQARASPRPWD